MTGHKHTPGPWRVVVDDTDSQVTGFPCIEANNYTVVGCEGMYGDIERDYANARLIAAAPDLLSLVEDALEDVTEFQTDWDKDARAAIEKAKGDFR